MKPRRLSRTAARAATAITLAGAIAAAHVAPSVDDNNRYLKLTPLGDRVRIAYTVFFGEVPGATARKAIDADRDGRISEAEGHAFGTALAAEVAAALDVQVDGAARPIRWASIDVGMGTPEVAAGAFSVDLVAYACFAAPRGRHHVVVRDRYRIARPGEVEARVEDSPGVQIDHARVGRLEDPDHDFRFAGPDGPLADDGLDVELVAGDRAVVAPDGDCPPAAASRPSIAVLALPLAGAAGLAGASWILARRRRNRA